MGIQHHTVARNRVTQKVNFSGNAKSDYCVAYKDFVPFDIKKIQFSVKEYVVDCVSSAQGEMGLLSCQLRTQCMLCTR